MSADDGIYIHHFRNGWRVVHTQAIENINYEPDHGNYNRRTLYDVFSGSPLFKTEKAAYAYAQKLYKKAVDRYGYTEYGICEV